jgi:hypothetical protein
MLDALSQCAPPRDRSTEKLADEARGQDETRASGVAEVAQDPIDDAVVPYIEVGGPRSAIDASPDVLAAGRSLPPSIAISLKPSPPPIVAQPATAADEACPAETFSIWCSWTLRSGMKTA